MLATTAWAKSRRAVAYADALRFAILPTLHLYKSRPQALVLESRVEMRDVFAVAVEQLSWPSLLGDDVLLGCLAPARMRHLRIDVRPEAIFGGLQVLPE